MIKIFKTIIFTYIFLGVCVCVHAASVSELLVNGTIKSLEKVGFQDPTIVKGKLSSLFKDVFPNNNITADQLEAMVDDLAKEDPYFKDLQKLLRQDTRNVSFKELEKAFIDSIKISHIKGKNLVCSSSCGVDDISALGSLKVVKMTDPALKRIKKQLDSLSTDQIQKLVSSSFNNNIPSSLDPIEKSHIAFFNLLKRSRNPLHRRFVKAVESLNPKNGSSNILAEGARFYRIPSTVDEFGDNEFQFYTKLIERTKSKRVDDPNLKIEDAFYQSLDDIISGKAVSKETKMALRDIKKEIKKKNCFFK